MKVALVRRRFTASGGAERYLAQLLAALAGAGHEVHLFAAHWTDLPPGVRFHQVPVTPGPAFLRILGFAWASRQMTRRGDFDLVHSFDRPIRPDVYRAVDGCHRAWLDHLRAVEGGIRPVIDRLNPLHRSILWPERRLFRPGGWRQIITIRAWCGKRSCGIMACRRPGFR